MALDVERPNIFRLYEENIGPLTPLIAEMLRDAEKTYPADWIEEAFKIAVENNVRRWRYIEAILRPGRRKDAMTKPIDETLRKIAADTSKANSPTSSSTDAGAHATCPATPTARSAAGSVSCASDLPLGHPDFGKVQICACRRQEVAQIGLPAPLPPEQPGGLSRHDL